MLPNDMLQWFSEPPFAHDAILIYCQTSEEEELVTEPSELKRWINQAEEMLSLTLYEYGERSHQGDLSLEYAYRLSSIIKNIRVVSNLWKSLEFHMVNTHFLDPLIKEINAGTATQLEHLAVYASSHTGHNLPSIDAIRCPALKCVVFPQNHSAEVSTAEHFS